MSYKKNGAFQIVYLSGLKATNDMLVADLLKKRIFLSPLISVSPNYFFY